MLAAIAAALVLISIPFLAGIVVAILHERHRERRKPAYASSRRAREVH